MERTRVVRKRAETSAIVDGAEERGESDNVR